MGDDADEVWRAAAARQFDALAEGWRGARAMAEARADMLLGLADFAPGDLILDAGCGSGNWSLALLRRGFRVRGVDLSPAMIDAARADVRAAGYAEADASFAVDPVERIDAPDGAFDGVLCLNVLDFTPRPGAGLTELGRVLRRGGRLAVATLGANSPVRREWWHRFLHDADPAETTCNGILPWETAALLRHLGWRIVAEQPLLGPSRTGATNPYSAEQVAALPDPILRQTVASSWLIVADHP